MKTNINLWLIVLRNIHKTVKKARNDTEKE